MSAASRLELPELPELLERLIPVVHAAGELVMSHYNAGFGVRTKDDDSPVTTADEGAEALIVPALQTLLPDVAVIAEESVAAGRVADIGRRFWLVDPLDGTREFIGRNGEFTVNIALVEDGRPVLGVVLAPALGRLFGGTATGGAFVEDGEGRRTIHCRWPPQAGLTVVASRSHADVAALQAFLADRTVAAFRQAGSSLKLCLIAAGEADLYPRLGRTMEWDIAAGHAILAAAGGSLTTLDGRPLRYGKPGFTNPHFVACGRRDSSTAGP
jgi:3'(2'), 5'-bisphosphate nucleotidase